MHILQAKAIVNSFVDFKLYNPAGKMKSTSKDKLQVSFFFSSRLIKCLQLGFKECRYTISDILFLCFEPENNEQEINCRNEQKPNPPIDNTKDAQSIIYKYE